MPLTKVPNSLLGDDVAAAIAASSATAKSEAIADATAASMVKLAGDVIQVVNTQTGALATGTTTMPNDDTIPQITEGNEYMTLAITPASASNILVIEVVAHFSSSAAQNFNAALFQDSTANALAASEQFMGATGSLYNIKFTHRMVAGTTSPTTFKLRAGGNNGGTTTFNGVSGTRVLGGVMSSSITITEIKA